MSNVSSQNPVEQVAEVGLIAHTDQEVSLVAMENDQVVTTSLKIAEIFGKQHKDVLKAVKSLDCSEDFRERNFALSKIDYQNGNIKKQLPVYYITRDGFVFLVMGFTGKTAAKWKEAYIKAFNDMEAKLRADRLGEEVQRAIEERDQKEYEEYLEQVRQEDEREYQHDKEVEEWHRQCEEAKAQAQAEEAKAQADDGIIQDYNGKRVVSSLTLAKLQGRKHYYVCDSIRRMVKYFARPGRVIYRRNRTVSDGNGGERHDGVVYYVTIEAFRTMCCHCHSITKEVQEQVLSAYNKAKGKGHHGKPVANAHVPEYKKRLAAKQAKTPTTPPTPTPTTEPTAQAQTPTVASMPQTPADLMQRFVKAMGVMMGVDTKEMFNLMNKGE